MDSARVYLSNEILKSIACDVVCVENVSAGGGDPNPLAERGAAVGRLVDLTDQHVFRPGYTKNV